MKVYLKANEKVFARFNRRLELEQADKADVALIVRDNETAPAEAIGSVIEETNGMLPVVVMTGPEDQIGHAYKQEAVEAGVPEHYILTGTHWRMSHLKKTLEELLKDPILPDPLIFDDERHVDDALVFHQEAAPAAVAASWGETPRIHVQTDCPLVVVTGWSGGAGKTTVATSLAALYHTRGLNVRLVDCTKHGDCAPHFNVHNEAGYYETEFGDLVLTMGRFDLLQDALRDPADIVILDLPGDSPAAEWLLPASTAVVVVAQPSEQDHVRLKAQLQRIPAKTVVVINKVDPEKPIRHSFAKMMTSDIAAPVVEVLDSEEVVSAFADRKPAVMRPPFDQAVAEIAAALNHD